MSAMQLLKLNKKNPAVMWAKAELCVTVLTVVFIPNDLVNL